jgi:amidase
LGVADDTPTIDDLRRASEALHLDMDDRELEEYLPFVAVFGGGMAAGGGGAGAGGARERPGPVAEAARWPRDGGRAPTVEENPYGAWAWLVDIGGAPDGPLAGRTVAIKDNVAVAGVPMTNGSAVMGPFVPDFDATIVTRILDAGGRITGKSACEDMCLSAASHTAASGPVRNPHDPTRTTGGSSSGSAALVAAGACDLAIGGDQGGSIRIPSALCGIYGIKPTHGLVPYTGAFPIDPTIDHLGPMGRGSADVALLLDVIAGPDGLDPRQHGVEGKVRPYAAGLGGGAGGLRVGLVTEGFGAAGAENEADAVVRGAAASLRELGATVDEVSVPGHRQALGLLGPILGTGMLRWVVQADGVGSGWEGWYPDTMADWFFEARRERGRRFAPTVKLMALVGQYATDRYGSGHYARAQNQVPALRAAYDDALARFDVLVMPTEPGVAPPLPSPEPSVTESLAASFGHAANTAQFDLTGHPAMSVPCGKVDGLPVGMMLIGRRFEDDVVLGAAHACEQTGAYVM